MCVVLPGDPREPHTQLRGGRGGVVLHAVAAAWSICEHHRILPRGILGATARTTILPSVVADGELSLMWLGGTVTHAVKKQAKPGDFRVQDDHGGTVVPHDVSVEEREFAERAMHVAVKVMDQRSMGEPLYARVDMVRDLGGAWAVSELEMVEPELWFRMCPDAATVLARAIAEHLTQPSA